MFNFINLKILNAGFLICKEQNTAAIGTKSVQQKESHTEATQYFDYNNVDSSTAALETLAVIYLFHFNYE